MLTAVVLALVYRNPLRDPLSIIVVCAGVAIVVLAAWSWWRIGATYRSYLLDLERYPASAA
jgi:hypothetical protein